MKKNAAGVPALGDDLYEVIEAATMTLPASVKLRLAAESLDKGLVHVALFLTTMVAVALAAQPSLDKRVLVTAPSGLRGAVRLRLAAECIEDDDLDAALCLVTETVNELADAAFEAQVERIHDAARSSSN